MQQHFVHLCRNTGRHRESGIDCVHHHLLRSRLARAFTAHSSTTIQVVNDILGVFVAVAVLSLILDSSLGLLLVNQLAG